MLSKYYCQIGSKEIPFKFKLPLKRLCRQTQHSTNNIQPMNLIQYTVPNPYCAGYNKVMPLAGGLGWLQPTRNLRFQLTLFQSGEADYAHRITACPPGFEKLTASLQYKQQKGPQRAFILKLYGFEIHTATEIFMELFLKVSKFQKQIFFVSSEPKTEQNYFLISSLRF